MAFHLSVAGSLEPLADTLAARLAEPLADPFATEVVVVPGDGVRRWLTARLARHLGATPGRADGIVANVDFVFPATLVRRALGPGAGLGAWSVGPLTWAVHDAVLAEPGHFGQATDAVRARAIADLFDRYALHRPQMVLRWSTGADVDALGAALPAHHRWQPALWRAVRAQLGGTSDAERLEALLAELGAGGTVAGTPVAEALPPRLFLVGLASLPGPQLQVLRALAAHVDVHVLAPSVSPERWAARRRALAAAPPLAHPLPRADDHLSPEGGHPLVTSWGRSSNEAHLLLLEAAGAAGAQVEGPGPAAPLGVEPTLLERLQHAVAADTPPPSPGSRPPLDTSDTSLRWHRCYGPARQVEVLRDALLHLLEEVGPDGTPRYEPRHVAVLCSDIATFAPLVEATFAGDPEHGVPAIPVRIADRTLRQDSPLLDATGALLELLEGRFRASEVLAFLARTPVRRRFALDAPALDRIAGWVDDTNVRWGLDDAHHAAYDVPPTLGAHTWRAGLDQLLVGAAMAPVGARLGPGAVVPHADVEGRDVEVAGRLAEFLEVLDHATGALAEPAPVAEWCARLAAAVRALCDVADDDAWEWVQLERTLEELAADASASGEPRTTCVEPADLVVLLGARLGAGGARARFGTGAVTVSALTAQRGVPHPVVCLLGLDPDTGASALPTPDDLTAEPTCVGDRDPRSEARAQLLDALMAAGERLVLLSTGRDVRTNEEVPPAAALAELLDVVDATVVPADGERRARDLIAVDHPRQAWSARNFEAGALTPMGPWSFDRVAHEAARRRAAAPAERQQGPYLPEPLAPLAEEPVLAVDALRTTCRHPTKAFLSGRLGIVLSEPDEVRPDAIPLDLDGLGLWDLAQQLLGQRLAHDGPWDPTASEAWEVVQRRRGAVPPMAFGADDLARAHTRVESLLGAVHADLGAPLPPREPVAVDVAVATTGPGGAGEVRLVGVVPDVAHTTALRVSASYCKPHDLLVAWLDLALLTARAPRTPWRALLVHRHKDDARADVHRLALRDPAHAAEVLAVMVDAHRRVGCDAVPWFAATTHVAHFEGLERARSTYESQWKGEADDAWVAHAFPPDFDSLLAERRRPDEVGEGWGDDDCRLACWAERIWGTFERTTTFELDPEPAGVGR